MLVLSQVAVAAASVPARADEPAAPRPLMVRALRARGLGPPARTNAVEAARWLPRLTLAAIVEQSAGSVHRDQTTVLGSLSWPLDDRTSGVAIEHERLRRQTSSQRQRLLERIAAAWQRRNQAAELSDELDAELSAQEADAELDVLTGRADEDGP